MLPRRIFNLANVLTLSRFAAAPVLLWLILRLAPPATPAFCVWVSTAALALLGVTLLTDLLDGWVARAYGIVTDFGKIMDPVADSTFFMTLLFALSVSPRFRDDFPVWIPILVLYREVGMQVLRRYGALRGRVLPAKFSGKAKMVVQSVAACAAMALIALSDLGLWRQSEPRLARLLLAAGIIIVAANLLSLLEYLREVPVLVREWRGEADLEEN